jgi:hypothetical protein
VDLVTRQFMVDHRIARNQEIDRERDPKCAACTQGASWKRQVGGKPHVPLTSMRTIAVTVQGGAVTRDALRRGENQRAAVGAGRSFEEGTDGASIKRCGV